MTGRALGEREVMVRKYDSGVIKVRNEPPRAKIGSSVVRVKM